MSEETAVSAPAPTAASPKTPKRGKKAGGAKVKKSRDAPAHPKIAIMVNTSIATLKERGGSSLQAIKKYISANYKVDVERMSPFIKKYLKSAVEKGALVQTKGKGATGSFRLSAGSKGAESDKPKVKKAAAKPKTAAKKAAPKAKKTVEKKTAAAKPKAAPAKAKATPKSPKKAKAAKPKKAKATKPKSPKVKKAKAPAKKAAKK